MKVFHVAENVVVSAVSMPTSRAASSQYALRSTALTVTSAFAP